MLHAASTLEDHRQLQAYAIHSTVCRICCSLCCKSSARKPSGPSFESLLTSVICHATVDAKQPEDWDEEEDGVWEPPRISNPACKDTPGCGEWKRPTKPNPAYKGKWVPAMIDNPEYKVRTAARYLWTVPEASLPTKDATCCALPK